MASIVPLSLRYAHRDYSWCYKYYAHVAPSLRVSWSGDRDANVVGVPTSGTGEVSGVVVVVAAATAATTAATAGVIDPATSDVVAGVVAGAVCCAVADPPELTKPLWRRT